MAGMQNTEDFVLEFFRDVIGMNFPPCPQAFF